MWEYLLRLALLLSLVGALVWGSLYLWKRVQTMLPPTATQTRRVRIVETLPVGAGSKLAIIEFGGRHHLIAIGRGTIQPLATDERGDFDAG